MPRPKGHKQRSPSTFEPISITLTLPIEDARWLLAHPKGRRSKAIALLIKQARENALKVTGKENAIASPDAAQDFELSSADTGASALDSGD